MNNNDDTFQAIFERYRMYKKRCLPSPFKTKAEELDYANELLIVAMAKHKDKRK